MVEISFKTKSVAVYDAIRKEIVDGKLKPGQKIVMRSLAKQFGLSEIPVREAIRKLESDGFVEFTPHVGAVVTTIDEKEFVETYLIRIELEALATRLAVPHVTAEDIAYLVKKNREMELSLKRNQPEKLGALNKDFHLRIYRAAPFPHLFKLIDELWEKMERTQSVFACVPERSAESIAEHSEIIEALRARDLAAAETLVKLQKSRTMSALQSFILKSGSDQLFGSLEANGEGKILSGRKMVG